LARVETALPMSYIPFQPLQPMGNLRVPLISGDKFGRSFTSAFVW
jgi:hypothetical protein